MSAWAAVGHVAWSVARAGALALAQALLGRRRRETALQGTVVVARVAKTRVALPGARVVLGSVGGWAEPLALLWGYGLGVRAFAPAHWRSLCFWKRSVFIYSRYKSTQVVAKRRNDEQRDKMWGKRHEWGAREVYALCVGLRGFYLKDGQYLGSRTDFIPAAWCESLKELQDHVPPVPWEQIEETIKQSFRVNKATQLFRSVDKVPLASATIAQVHRGELPDGTSIVLKSQYKDQEELCDMDLANLKRLAAFLQKHDMQFFDLHSVVEEFEKQIPGEFDFIGESIAMTIIAENMERAGLSSEIVIPRAITGLVSRRTLAMTFVDGVRPDNLLAMNLWGIKPEKVVTAVGRAIGQQILVDGLAHCDVHMGNVLVLRDGRVALLDFGQTKRIPEDIRLRLCQFYTALGTGHPGYIAKCFADLGIELDMPEGKVDESLLAMIPMYANGLLDTAPLPADVEISPFSSKSPLQQLPIKTFPSELFMILRTMGALRALCDSLNVEVVMSQVFAPFARKGARTRVDAGLEKRRERRVADSLTAGVVSPLTQPQPSMLDRLFGV